MAIAFDIGVVLVATAHILWQIRLTIALLLTKASCHYCLHAAGTARSPTAATVMHVMSHNFRQCGGNTERPHVLRNSATVMAPFHARTWTPTEQRKTDAPENPKMQAGGAKKTSVYRLPLPTQRILPIVAKS